MDMLNLKKTLLHGKSIFSYEKQIAKQQRDAVVGKALDVMSIDVKTCYKKISEKLKKSQIKKKV